MKAHKWGDVIDRDPVVTNKCEWGQHSDQPGHHPPTRGFTHSPILAQAASSVSDKSQMSKTIFINVHVYVEVELWSCIHAERVDAQHH